MYCILCNTLQYYKILVLYRTYIRIAIINNISDHNPYKGLYNCFTPNKHTKYYIRYEYTSKTRIWREKNFFLLFFSWLSLSLVRAVIPFLAPCYQNRANECVLIWLLYNVCRLRLMCTIHSQHTHTRMHNEKGLYCDIIVIIIAIIINNIMEKRAKKRRKRTFSTHQN